MPASLAARPRRRQACRTEGPSLESYDRISTQWLKTFPTPEYQRCAPGDHKAAGYTVVDDGTPMSINVEMIGTGLVVQRYRFEVSEAHYCKMVSISYILTPSGWTTTQVIWELRMASGRHAGGK
ncbi:hypothetical protein [Mycobacterium sp. AT1]|uniref:hypothetical protein n=1 Tax=Mycobacterium sp. AT1 TaxID=1961706 RepID=UPI001E56E32E|nr:hypothetical protein [Mycobacterium sp. AT1]